jgi:hypothetical protein
VAAACGCMGSHDASVAALALAAASCSSISCAWRTSMDLSAASCFLKSASWSRMRDLTASSLAVPAKAESLCNSMSRLPPSLLSIAIYAAFIAAPIQ